MLAVVREICRTVRFALKTWQHTLRLCVIGVVLVALFVVAR